MLGASATVLCSVVPVAVYGLGLFVLYSVHTRSFDGFHLVLVAVTTLFLAAPLVLAAAGASMAWCLVVLALTPWVTVVGYELRGHAHNARVIARITGREPYGAPAPSPSASAPRP